jgi:hypothetical protein
MSTVCDPINVLLRRARVGALARFDSAALEMHLLSRSGKMPRGGAIEAG